MKRNCIMKKMEKTDVNKTKVFVENEEAKAALNEDIQNNVWVDLETARERLLSFVDNLENTYGNADSNLL